MTASILYELALREFTADIPLEGALKGTGGIHLSGLVPVWERVERRIEDEFGADSVELLSVWAFYKVLHRQTTIRIENGNEVRPDSVSLIEFRRELEECLQVEGWESEYKQYKRIMGLDV